MSELKKNEELEQQTSLTHDAPPADAGESPVPFTDTVSTADDTGESPAPTADTVSKAETETTPAPATDDATESHIPSADTASTTETETASTADDAGESPAPASEKSKSNLPAIVIGLLVFFGLLFALWHSHGGAAAERGVLYTRDNALYYYDTKHEPYLVQENISNGGDFYYYYSAWGATVSEDGRWIYYAANIDPNGSFDLYRRDARDVSAESLPIASHVYNYQISTDGSAAAYLAIGEGEDSVQLCAFDGMSTRVIAEDLQWQQNLYDLSSDGKYLVYYDAYSMLRTEKIGTDEPSVVLTDSAAMYALADETDNLYYVAENGDVYDIYSYDFASDPVLLAENVSYMELMPNGRDLLYCAASAENIPYSEILVDDMAEADADLTEADGAAWEEKLQRDEIRAAIAAGEGISPLLQEAYVLKDGKSIKVAEDVVSAMAVENDAPFLTGYQIDPPEPMPLSELEGGLDMLELYYYLALNYSEFQPFLADANGMCQRLTGYQVLLDTLQISADGKRAAYVVNDANMGGNILMEMEIGKAEDASAVATNIERFAFLGGNGPLCYAYTENGVNGLTAGEKTITNVNAVEFAEDAQAVYYIADADAVSGVGQLQIWDGVNEPTTVDEGVFAFRNLGDGKFALIEGDDAAEGSASLHYFDGKSVSLLDESITALYMD